MKCGQAATSRHDDDAENQEWEASSSWSALVHSHGIRIQHRRVVTNMRPKRSASASWTSRLSEYRWVTEMNKGGLFVTAGSPSKTTVLTSTTSRRRWSAWRMNLAVALIKYFFPQHHVSRDVSGLVSITYEVSFILISMRFRPLHTQKLLQKNYRLFFLGNI